MRHDPLFHSILSTDVEKSSGRNDNLLLRMRTDLREILTDTFIRQQIDAASLTTVDDGDGFRFLLPAGNSPHSLLDPFLGRLGIELRAHRYASSPENRLRLRVAIHSGLLFREDSGAYTGTPLKDCARLLDAPAGRELLAGHPDADMVVLVSDVFYRDVVAGGTTLDPAWFQRIPVRVKETDAYGWAYVPGVAPPPQPPRSEDAEPDPSGPRHSSVSIDLSGSGNASIGNVAGRDIRTGHHHA